MENTKTFPYEMFCTLTWTKGTKAAVQDVRRWLQPIARKHGNHIFFEMFEGIQEKRYRKYQVIRPDVHVLLAFEKPLDNFNHFLISAQLDTRWNAIQQCKQKRICEIVPFAWRRYWFKYWKQNLDADKSKVIKLQTGMPPPTLDYLFKHQDGFFQDTACIHGTKCRRKGCVYRYGRSPYVLEARAVETEVL